MKIHIHVKPGSKTTSAQWADDLFGNKTLILKIRERPENGEANIGVIEAIAALFEIPKSSIRITHGHTSRQKIVEIPNATYPLFSPSL